MNYKKKRIVNINDDDITTTQTHTHKITAIEESRIYLIFFFFGLCNGSHFME